MANKRSAPWIFALGAGSLGCGGATVGLSSVTGSDAPGATSLTALLAPGRRVVLRDGAACSALVASTYGELDDTQAKLADASWGKRPTIWRVESALVKLGQGPTPGYLAVELADGPQPSQWVRIATGAPLTCIVPLSEEIVNAVKLAGTKASFAPWRETCQRIEAAGAGASSLVVDPDSAANGTFGELSLDAQGRPWLQAGGAALRVRVDTARGCFEEPKGGDAPGALALLHLPLGRCTRGDDGGREHVECRSTVGVWEGVVADDAVSLRLVRRTLGPVHFTGGVPVDGQRYARTVVSVSTGAPPDERGKAIADAIQRSVAGALAKGGGSIRVAPPSDPAVGHKLEIDAAAVTIGELTKHQEGASSQYQDGTREVPNPAYAEAQSAVGDARAKVERARADHQRDVQAYENNKATMEQAKQSCLQGCDMNQNANLGALCRTGCNAGGAIGGALMHPPGNEGIDAAEGALRDAERTVESTPRTVTEPIMKTWPYEKTVFARSTSTTLHVVVRTREGEPTRFDIPVSQSWQDYDVKADPAHDVDGHEASRGPIERPDALVPWLADRASAALAKRLHTTLEQAELAEAKRAMASGDKTAKPGFEDVDAKAYDVSSGRLLGPVQRGTATVRGEAGSALPSEGVRLEAGTCLLAVAVADGDEPAALTLATSDGTFADRLGRRVTSVEACAEEIQRSGGKLDLALRSKATVPVHWGLYRTRGAGKAAGKRGKGE
jgi:hypothetical protein